MDLHRLTHSFPTRRSSDLSVGDRRQIEAPAVIGHADLHPVPLDHCRDDDAAFRSLACRLTHVGRFDAVVDGIADEQIGRAHVELQSLMRKSYAVFCLNKKKSTNSVNSPCSLLN